MRLPETQVDGPWVRKWVNGLSKVQWQPRVGQLGMYDPDMRSMSFSKATWSNSEVMPITGTLRNPQLFSRYRAERLARKSAKEQAKRDWKPA